MILIHRTKAFAFFLQEKAAPLTGSFEGRIPYAQKGHMYPKRRRDTGSPHGFF